ncbi:S10 family serine carboxypeptidase-like protein [Sorangium sp. So ce388]|uniref:S10 family serine carboxypeptidase-like protein n=1 Tax=Sorangium sp. So ce388 TaxID=3133309 RepID=UPI003F5BEC34
MLALLCRFGGLATVLALTASACGGSSDSPGGDGGSAGACGSGGTGGAEDATGSDLPEAGFIEVPGSPTLGPGWTSRMFYSFVPAAEHPERAPLLVFFNGGPGSATTSVLLPYGTGPFTLDPAAPTDAAPVANDVSYTRFANLLYVDARSTGFSYDLALPDPSTCQGSSGKFHVADAADFIYLLLEFLDAHEALRDNPVVIAGESYGGTRAALMLYMLHNYTLTLDSAGVMSVAPSWLREKVQAHLDLTFPAHAGAPREPSEVAEQFGWQLLIQPSLFGMQQSRYQRPLAAMDPDLAPSFTAPDVWDGYDVRLTQEQAAPIQEHASRSMRNPEHLETLLGVDLSSITGLAPPERQPSFRSFSNLDPAEVAASETDLRAELGELDAADAYWLRYAPPCPGDGVELGMFAVFEDIIGRTATFITNARYDSVVYTEALPAMFDEFSTFDVELDPSLPEGAARPGVLHLRNGAGGVSFRFPTYEAGHQVSVGAPRELAEDVEAWLAAACASAP